MLPVQAAPFLCGCAVVTGMLMLQVGVFSATLPPEALEITRKFMNKPVGSSSFLSCDYRFLLLKGSFTSKQPTCWYY